jgi:hypothetical protein
VVQCKQKPVRCDSPSCATVTLTEYNQTNKVTARTNCKVTLCFNILRWDGIEFALDASSKGRRKKNKHGDRVWASTKLRRTQAYTKQMIWHRDEDAERTEIEKIRETLWRVRVRVVSLANLAAIKATVGVTAAAIETNLVELEARIQQVKETVENAVGVMGECGEGNTEVSKTLHTSIHFCVNEEKLCRERLNRRVRIEETFGFTLAPSALAVESNLLLDGATYTCTTATNAT